MKKEFTVEKLKRTPEPAQEGFTVKSIRLHSSIPSPQKISPLSLKKALKDLLFVEKWRLKKTHVKAI